MKLAEPSEKTLREVTDPDLWRDAVREASREALDNSGGKRNWHARAAQRAVQIYKSRGGGYLSPKKPSDGLTKWQQEDWVTLHPKTGNILGPCGIEHEDYPDTPLRCLPRARAKAMSPTDRRKTARIKAEAPIGENVSNVDTMGRSKRRRKDLAAYLVATQPGLREHEERGRREQESQERSQSGYYIAPGDEDTARGGIPSRVLEEQHHRQAQQVYRATQEDRDKQASTPRAYGRRYMAGTLMFDYGDDETMRDPVTRAHDATQAALQSAQNVFKATDDPIERAKAQQSLEAAQQTAVAAYESAQQGDMIEAEHNAAASEAAAAAVQAVESNVTGGVEPLPPSPPTTEADAPEPKQGIPVGLILLGGFIAYQMMS